FTSSAASKAGLCRNGCCPCCDDSEGGGGSGDESAATDGTYWPPSPELMAHLTPAQLASMHHAQHVLDQQRLLQLQHSPALVPLIQGWQQAPVPAGATSNATVSDSQPPQHAWVPP